MNARIRKLQQRLKNRSALAIHLKSSSISVSLVKSEEGVARVIRAFTLPHGADAVVATPEKIGTELAERLQAEGIRERRCVACVPPGWALTTSTEVPEISEEDLTGYLELRAEREFPIAISELRLAYCIYLLPDEKRRATIAAVSASRLGAVEKMLEAAGCRISSLSLGLDRFVGESSSPASVHFLANGTHVDLVIAAGGGIAALRSLAGSVAQEESAFDAAGFCREVRITLGGLPDAARQQVREAHFGGPPKTAELLCLQTRDYLRRMGLDPVAIERGPDSEGPAFEAANQFLHSRPVAFEFLPPQTPRWQVLFQRFDNRRRRLLVGAAVLFLAIPGLALYVQSRIHDNLLQEWNGMKGKVADLDELQQNIRLFRPWFDPAPENLSIFEALISAFPETGDVWAKSIQISEGQKVNCTGFARNHAALLGLLDRFRKRAGVTEVQLQQERGENPIQFSATFKWEPVHAK